MAAKGITIKSHMGSRYKRASQSGSTQQLASDFKANINELLAGFKEFCDAVDGMTPGVLVDALEETFGKAIEYCPEKSGALRDSAYLEVESYRGRHVVAIGFGRGGQPDYAVFVHEMPYEHASPTRSKFLQAALDEDYYTILNKIPGLIRERAGT